jgi:biopolymer transport protein ExbD
VGGEYDLKALSGMVVSLKREHPQSDDASVLMAPDVEYNNLIQVMDAIRSADQGTAAAAGLVAANGTGPVPMFTKIAVGDAP